MEGSESSMNRIGRTIWTVWGFLTGAVGRYLRPDVANEGDQNVNQEDTVTRSYKELKEKEEEKEKAWSQSEKPQSGVNVRTAAVQWEKGAVRSEHASKPTRSGVAWNTEVREGRSEDVDKKGRERRDHEETSDNNNEAARASDAVADVEQVRPPASADGSQDFGVSASADEDGDVRKSENEVEDLVKSESAESVESDEQDLEEQTSEHDFGDTSEVLVEKVTEPTDGLDKSEDNVDDLVSQLTCSSRERGDLLNKELKVEEPNENKASPTPEEEVIDANNAATKQETVGTVKDGQHEVDHQLTEFAEVAETVESKLDEDYTEFNEGIVETECELLEEPVPAPGTENAETSEKEPEPFTRIIEKQISPTSGRDEIDNTEGREAGRQFKESEAAESFGICHSNLDEAHTEFTEAITETDYKLLEEAVTAQVGIVEVYEKEPTTEGDVTEAVSEETADQQEAGQQLRESMGSEIADGPDIHESMVETQFEDRVEAKCEPLEEPVAEQEPKEPEAVSEPTESRISSSQEGEPIDSIEDLEARQQFSESTAAEIVDVCESQLDEDHTEFAEAIVETKLEHLEEPVAEQEPKEPEPISKPTESRISSPQEGEPIDSTEDLEARQQFSESKAAEIVDVCESQLDEDHTDFAEAIVETKLEHLEEPVAEQTDIAEIPEEPEPLGRMTQKKAPEEEAILEESKQGTVGTAKDEAGQRSVDPKAAESFDVCHSKLDEAQFEFTEEVVENRHEHLEEPVAEQESKEPEPASKPTESRISSSQEREPIHSTEDLEARQQFGESKAAETVDVYESQLDEDHTEFAEAEVETKLEHLEEPVAEPTDIAEISEEPEPLSRITEKKAPEEEAIFEESKQGTVGTAKDEAGQRSVDPKTAESFDVCHSKPDEAQFEFTEEVVETRHEQLEEPVAEQIEVHETEPEPFSKVIENRASPTPEREVLGAISEETKQVDAGQQFSESKAAESKLDEDGSDFQEGTVETACELLEEPVMAPMDLEPVSEPTEIKAAPSLKREAIEEAKLETVGTVQDGQHEAGQQLSESKDAEIVNICESKLDEAQYTEEAVTAECKLLEEEAQMYEQEPKDVSKIGLIMAETSGDESANLSAAAVEAGQLEHRGEGTEEEPSREAEVEHRDVIAKDILAEMVIKHDNESVDTGPGNQTETLETTSNFQQEVREEVVADDVKKSAERSSQAQPVAREALALQEAMDQSSLKQEPQEKSVEENVNDELGLLKAPAEQEDDTPVNMPSSSPQEPEDSLAACVELMVEAKTIRTEQKVEALETHVGSTAESDQAATEVKCVRAESEMDAITESESSPAAAESSEMLKNSTEASDLDVGQIPLSLGSTTQTHGVQIEYSGALSLPESEPVDQQTSEIQRNLQKDAEDALEVLQMQRGPQKQVDVDRPDEAEIRLQEEIKTMTTSSGVVEELMSGLSQDLQERQSLSSVEPHVQTKTKKKGSAFESFVETSESESATLQTYSTNTEERKHLQVETMDLVGDEEAETDSNANVQRRTRPALKRGSEKMTRDEKDEPSKSRSWAATDLLLQQVSSLDCTVQKSKIAVKNPLVRPPKDPRTLINMASVEPLAPARPTQPGPLRTGHGVALPVPQKVTGFKLPGLGAGFPVLRKTDAGRKMRDEGETESESTPKQKSDVLTKPKEDCVKPEQPVSKPKWTPPRHPGMGGPLMMSELKSKLKKPGKD